MLADLLDGGSGFGPSLARDENEIARAALDHLALDRLHPDAAGRPVFTNAVQQNAKLSIVFFTRGGQVRVPPLELDDQVIVLVFLFGDEAAECLAGDADGALDDGEDLVRIVVLAVRLLPLLGSVEVGVKVGEVLAVEQLDRFSDRVGSCMEANLSSTRRESLPQIAFALYPPVDRKLLESICRL